jgi:hypothetical protein
MVRLSRRIFIVLTLVIFINHTRAQSAYPFASNFTRGIIQFPDGSQKTGLIKWYPAQEEKLIFRENEKAPKQKFPPEELAGFQVDSLRFRSISEFKVYGNDFVLLGKMTKVSHTFGQLIDSGKVNSYLVYYSGYNALAGSPQSYLNILFEKKTDSGYVYAAFPVDMRMRDKKFEKVKDSLILFFSDYPAVAEKLKFLRQQDDFTDILNLLKKM